MSCFKKNIFDHILILMQKMKTEKILELRAEEAKRLGIGLRSYLRKIQQRMV